MRLAPWSHIGRAVVVLVGLTLVVGVASAFQITFVDPPRLALQAWPDLTTITVRFSAPVQMPVTPAQVRVAGGMSGLHAGTINVMDNQITWTNTGDPFLRGEMVSVSLHRNIRSTGNVFLIGGRNWMFTIASGPGTMAWSPRWEFGAASVPYFIYGGDIDEDNRPDVAAPNEITDDVSIFINGAGPDRFQNRVDYPVGNKPSCIFGDDFDNDGDQDLATAEHNSGTVTVLLNNGDGTFGAPTSYPSGWDCRQVHGGDFDGDNDIDLAATGFLSGEVHLFYNNGAGTFAPGVLYTDVPPGPFAIRCADLNNDWKIDIAVACQQADSLTVLTNNGLGGFFTSGTYRVASLPWCLNGNDMDGDGDFDLVSVASFADRVVVLKNDGAGGFPVRNLYPTGSFPLGVYVADLDGDGDIDVSSSNYSGGTVGVYRNNGTGALTLQATLPCDISGSYSWAHDLDGDGDLDLSVVDEEADFLFVWYNGSIASDVADGGAIFTAKMGLRPNPLRGGEPMTLSFSPMRESLLYKLAAEGDADGETAARVDLFGVDGRRLRTLWQGAANVLPSDLIWDGRGATGERLANGAYFAVLRCGPYEVSRSLRLIE